MKIKHVFCVIIGVIIMLQGCKNKKDFNSLSPRQMADLYIKAYNDRDTELLRKITYFPSGTSEADIEKKINPPSHSNDAKGAERLLAAAGVKISTKYEKLLSEDTAEVGIVMKMGIGALSKQIPADQLMMKKDEGIWKFHYAVSMLTKEQLMEIIKKDPKTAWVHYQLGMQVQSDNPYKACERYQKYYELEPKGFWVNDELLHDLDILRNPSKEEKKLLISLGKFPEKSGGRIIAYVRLAQLSIVTKNYDKAQEYLRQADEVIKAEGSVPLDLKAMVEEAKKELENEMTR